MNPRNPKRIVGMISLTLFFAIASHAQKPKLVAADAVRLAEQFIAQNGYTDLPPDKGKLAYETVEWETSAEEIFKERYDTLDRKAYGLVHGMKGGSAGWTVVFRYKHPDSQTRRTGRAVTMKPNGTDMQVEHVDFILRYVDKRILNASRR